MADESQRHRIEVECPECKHRQAESSLVVSTQCRSCWAYFNVLNGKSVPKSQPAVQIAKPTEKPLPSSSLLSTEKKKLYPFLVTTIRASLSSSLARLAQMLPDWLRRSKPPREVRCFQCEHTFIANSDALSSQCSKCGCYVSLQNYDITTNWNRRIQTRGNVVIQKLGVVSSTTLRCHNLTVLGELTGSVECSGDFIIRNHGKIIGSVRCRNLRVERGAHVEFLNPVTADAAFIDGQVYGQILCNGAVVLKKRAHLHGLVRTSSLVVELGAKHTGTIEMVSRSSSQ